VKSHSELPFMDYNCQSTEERSECSDATSHRNGIINSGCSSLMADFSPDYLDDFVLHGVKSNNDTHNSIIHNLNDSIMNSPVEEPVAECVCILADCDNWYVNLLLLCSYRCTICLITADYVTHVHVNLGQSHRMIFLNINQLCCWSYDPSSAD
jgi:hypothetical protein